MDDAAADVADAAIVIMNPPFTNRTKMGQKFDKPTQKALRDRMNTLEGYLKNAEPRLSEFMDMNSLGPRFAALADLCLNREQGVFATVIPTTALTNTSGRPERKELAARFGVHTILTCHHPDQINLSQNTDINESIVVLQRSEARMNTRIIALDRFPADAAEVDELHGALAATTAGTLAHGWGEVSQWPVERVQAGDWSAAAWRSPLLAVGAARFAEWPQLHPMCASGLSAKATGQMLRGAYRRAASGDSGAFPILKSKSADAQTRIEATPDEWWAPKRPHRDGKEPMEDKAGYLLVTAGQDTSSARLVAVASDKLYVGNGWTPVTGLGVEEAKAVSVFLNSTPGRMLLMSNPGRKLMFPAYAAADIKSLPVPDFRDPAIRGCLADCWRATRHIKVSQYRDGYTDVRRLWDAAVCEALDWDIDEIAQLGHALAREPHVRGVAYGQWKP